MDDSRLASFFSDLALMWGKVSDPPGTPLLGGFDTGAVMMPFGPPALWPCRDVGGGGPVGVGVLEGLDELEQPAAAASIEMPTAAAAIVPRRGIRRSGMGSSCWLSQAA
jgi:hypothetical protein